MTDIANLVRHVSLALTIGALGAVSFGGACNESVGPPPDDPDAGQTTGPSTHPTNLAGPDAGNTERSGGDPMTSKLGGDMGPGGEPLDRGDGPTLAVDRERETRQQRFAIHEHGAGTALAQLAPVLGAGELQIFPQRLEQRLVAVDEDLHGLAVHRAREPCLASRRDVIPHRDSQSPIGASPQAFAARDRMDGSSCCGES